MVAVTDVEKNYASSEEVHINSLKLSLNAWISGSIVQKIVEKLKRSEMNPLAEMFLRDCSIFTYLRPTLSIT